MSKIRVWSIYALTRRGKAFYVGRTIHQRGRLAGHKRTFGQSIKMQILQETRGNLEEAAQAEAKWMSQLKSEGCILINKVKAAKGGGIWDLSPETRSKLQTAHVEQKKTRKYREDKKKASKARWAQRNAKRESVKKVKHFWRQARQNPEQYAQLCANRRKAALTIWEVTAISSGSCFRFCQLLRMD